MKTIFKRRLLKLARHLEDGKLGHREFNFRYIHVVNGDEEEKNYCGSQGCALGECPVVFPSKWAFRDEGKVHLKNRKSFHRCSSITNTTFLDAKKFFGLSHVESVFLFSPNQFFNNLSGDATRNEVARNIRRFVAGKVKPRLA